MNGPTLSKKLRSENKKLHSSISIVLFVVFITVAVSVFFMVAKNVFFKPKVTKVEVSAETDKTIQETAIAPKTDNANTYKVESGDTLYAIGIKLGVDWKEIAKLNDLEPPYSLSTNQELKIPNSASETNK